MRLSLVTPPGEEPISIGEAILHLRAGSGDESLIQALIEAAREDFETETGRQLVTATWQVKLSGFPKYCRGVAQAIEIPLPPLQQVNFVKYVDSSGVQQTWDPTQYQVDTFVGPRCQRGRLYPKPGVMYPGVLDIVDAVTIEFVAGYGEPGAVPSVHKALIKLMIGELYANRERTVAGTIVTENPVLARAVGKYRLPVYA